MLISPPSLCKYCRDKAKFKNPKRYCTQCIGWISSLQSIKLCKPEEGMKKRPFIYSCIPLSLHLPLTSVPFCVTWLIWAWKITHDKSPGWLDLSLAVSLFRSLSSPSSFQPFLSHERQGLPIMPVYGLSREKLFSCVTGVCVSVRLNRKCAALTDTTLFPLTGSGLLCLIQQRECLC